jgi:hypothetical protein
MRKPPKPLSAQNLGRYRKVYVRVWGDEGFRSLSKPQPNGQTLWLYLLTGEHTGALPGLFRAGEAQLAEALGWSLKAFREAFREVFQKGMAKADWEARLVFLPKASVYNPPESPNVVKAWRAAFDELPECPLKHAAFLHLKGFLEGFHEGFAKAWGKPLPNQEQEQEQEDRMGTLSGSAPDLKSNPETKIAARATPTRPDPDPERFERFWAAYPRREGKQDAREAFRRLDPDEILLERIVADVSERYVGVEPIKIPHPSTYLNGKRWEDEAMPSQLMLASNARPPGYRPETALEIAQRRLAATKAANAKPAEGVK